MAERDKDGKFGKGHARLEGAGRKEGVENKLNREARELFTKTLAGEVEHIQDAFEKVREKDPAKYLELYAKYAQYFVPKKIEVEGELEPVKQVFKIGNVVIEL